MRRTVALSCGLLLGISVLVAAGCSSNQPISTVSIPPMWQAQFDQALADPRISDFERQVLSNPPITDAEYQQAQDLFSSCMADRGFTVTFQDQGGYSVSAKTSAYGTQSDYQGSEQSAEAFCQIGTIDYIVPIYWGMKSNPQGLSGVQQVRLCYREHNVPDGAGMSDDEFADQILRSDTYVPSSTQAALCYFDPMGQNGLTMAAAEDLRQGRIKAASANPTASPSS